MNCRRLLCQLYKHILKNPVRGIFAVGIKSIMHGQHLKVLWPCVVWYHVLFRTMRLRFLIIWLSPNICYVQSVARLTFSGFHKVLVVRLCLNKVLFKYCYTQVAVAPTGWEKCRAGILSTCRFNSWTTGRFSHIFSRCIVCSLSLLMLLVWNG